ncbi:major histocompatibility complex class I-related gene protein-like isoform X2 [Alligator sinensis]|uniref:Major histocompatibility complex class I-related gene protein-like isoform X2 n=1 Tax=Alligator sinensis TaxID=38654 RepID=A0A3Q0HL30_ALLSI|nr:major histocompatibility complex class I-related gene protein-like isoform X2 [Alligator sinensis]
MTAGAGPRCSRTGRDGTDRAVQDLPRGTASSPSYRHFYTGVLDPSPGVPAFTAVSYVNDQKILHYDSETRREEPRGDWVQGAVDPDFWERETRSLRGWQRGFEGNQVTLRHRYNQTDWSHTLQFMYGCELGEDNSTEGYMQFGYDGEDFISYDLRTHTWVAVPTEARVTQSRWNGDKNLLLIVRAYLEWKCIEWLRKYLQHGKAALQSKSPMSQVSDRPSSWARLTTLSCQVHGFYPKNISVVWLKNGVAQPQETSCSEVLPSGDGTYQTWATIEIDPNSNHNYTCCVEHVSLGADLRVAWDKSRQKPESSLNLALIITIVLVIIAAMSTAIYFLRKWGPGHRAETLEQSQLQHPLQSSAEPREAHDNSCETSGRGETDH